MGQTKTSRYPGVAWIAAAAGLAALAAAAATTIAVGVHAGPLPGDEWITTVQGVGSLETAAQSTRNMNAADGIALAGAIMAGGLWYSGRRQQAIILLVGLASLILLTLGLKNIIERDRPGAEFEIMTIVGRSGSYPSGHATVSTLLYGYIAYIVLGARIQPWARWAALGLLAGLLFANFAGTVYSGAHWASDFAGGLLWAAVVLAVLIAIDQSLQGRATRPAWARTSGNTAGTTADNSA